jgi:hypothetical protein
LLLQQQQQQKGKVRVFPVWHAALLTLASTNISASVVAKLLVAA